MNEYFKPFFNPWHYGLKDYKEWWAWKNTAKSWLYNNPRYFFKWIKWSYQRATRGWADCDWWEMHSYLCDIIIPMLEKMKKDKHGFPCGYDEDFGKCEKEWNANLDKMIEGFKAAKRVVNDEYEGDVKDWIKMSEADVKIFEKNMKIFAKNFFSLWD